MIVKVQCFEILACSLHTLYARRDDHHRIVIIVSINPQSILGAFYHKNILAWIFSGTVVFQHTK